MHKRSLLLATVSMIVIYTGKLWFLRGGRGSVNSSAILTRNHISTRCNIFDNQRAYFNDAFGNQRAYYNTNAGGQHFGSNGNFSTQWGDYGGGERQFAGPACIASDSKGNVYVADTGNDRVQKFTSNGTFLATWDQSEAGTDAQFFNPQGI